MAKENKFFETANLGGEEKEVEIKKEEKERLFRPEDIEAEVRQITGQLYALKDIVLELREKMAKAKGKKKTALEQDLRLVEEQIAESEEFLDKVDSGEFEIEEIEMKPTKEELETE